VPARNNAEARPETARATPVAEKER